LRSIWLVAACALLGLWLVVGLKGRGGSLQPQPVREQEPEPVTVVKQPVNFATRTFDPAAPPPDMPPLGPGEAALCDSGFTSSANITGESHRSDATHAVVTITHVNVTLQLNVTIWVPNNATEKVIEHEQGHRQISEYYYKSADKLAERIAETYLGRRVEVSGSDLGGEANRLLEQMAQGFTNEYNKELDPDPAQQLYDTITDHSRNDMAAKDAVEVALKDAEETSPHPVTTAAN